MRRAGKRREQAGAVEGLAGGPAKYVHAGRGARSLSILRLGEAGQDRDTDLKLREIDQQAGLK